MTADRATRPHSSNPEQVLTGDGKATIPGHQVEAQPIVDEDLAETTSDDPPQP